MLKPPAALRVVKRLKVAIHAFLKRPLRDSRLEIAEDPSYFVDRLAAGLPLCGQRAARNKAAD